MIPYKIMELEFYYKLCITIYGEQVTTLIRFKLIYI